MENNENSKEDIKCGICQGIVVPGNLIDSLPDEVISMAKDAHRYLHMRTITAKLLEFLMSLFDKYKNNKDIGDFISQISDSILHLTSDQFFSQKDIENISSKEFCTDLKHKNGGNKKKSVSSETKDNIIYVNFPNHFGEDN